MQIAASFVEYLVTGCTALLWIAVLVPETVIRTLNERDKVLILLVPVVYVLGMLIDYASLVIAEPFKNQIRRLQDRRKVPDSDPRIASIQSARTFISLHSPDLGKELGARSTRDRIARGAFVNALLLATAMQFRGRDVGVGSPNLMTGIAMFLAIVAFGMWWRFEGLTRAFRHDAVRTILEWAALPDSAPRSLTTPNVPSRQTSGGAESR